jgi:hypothetical protein
MSYFAPNLIPEHHMHSALITPDEFDKGIVNLEPRLAMHLLYVRDSDEVMVAPLHKLTEVDTARIEAEQSNPEFAQYLREVTARWIMIITRCAMEHPLRSKILQGIEIALRGDLPNAPAWTRAFDRALVTGEDNQIYLPPKSRICSPEEQQGWGLNTEPAADLVRVLDFLGYGRPDKIKRGRKPM